MCSVPTAPCKPAATRRASLEQPGACTNTPWGRSPSPASVVVSAGSSETRQRLPGGPCTPQPRMKAASSLPTQAPCWWGAGRATPRLGTELAVPPGRLSPELTSPLCSTEPGA